MRRRQSGRVVGHTELVTSTGCRIDRGGGYELALSNGQLDRQTDGGALRSGLDWALGVAARSQALVSDD